MTVDGVSVGTLTEASAKWATYANSAAAVAAGALTAGQYAFKSSDETELWIVLPDTQATALEADDKAGADNAPAATHGNLLPLVAVVIGRPKYC